MALQWAFKPQQTLVGGHCTHNCHNLFFLDKDISLLIFIYQNILSLGLCGEDVQFKAH